MIKINPYLIFDGQAEEAFNFYKSILGGEFEMLQKMKDAPSDVPSSEEDQEKIMHVSLPIGDGNLLMGSDRPSSSGTGTKGDNFNISINTESKEEADRIFYGLAEGGKELMGITDTFWNAYFGMLRDKFDVQWMVSYDYK